MRLVALSAAVLFGALSLVTYSPSSAHAVKQSNDKKDHVIVESGDNLSKIAKAKDTTFQRLFYANESIEDPDLIYPGQELRIPSKDEKLTKRPIPGNAPVAPAPAPVAPAANPQPAAPAPAPTRSYQPAAAPAAAPSGGVWDRLAACESGGNWHINTGNGFYGGLQFTLSSWQAVGGSGYPHQASKAEQIMRAQKLQAIQGWGAWPACTAKLGIR